MRRPGEEAGCVSAAPAADATPLKRDASSGGDERVAVSSACRQAAADHHARLRPLVCKRERVDSRSDVDVTRDGLVNEVKLIALAPDVRARRVDIEDPA